MTTEQKRQAIIKAVAEKKVSGKQLEPKRKGSTISRIKAGKLVKDTTVDKIYVRLIELCPEYAIENAIERPKMDNSMLNTIDRLKSINERLKAENDRLKVDNDRLKIEQMGKQRKEQNYVNKLNEMEKRLQTLEQKTQITEQKKQDTGERIFGFRLVKKTTHTKNHQYQKWYAVKGNKVVYIGANLSKAEEKIKAYMERRAMN